VFLSLEMGTKVRSKKAAKGRLKGGRAKELQEPLHKSKKKDPEGEDNKK